LIHRRGGVLGGSAVRAACGGNPSRPYCHQGGAVAVMASSAPASQQIEHPQPDHHQGKEMSGS
jgi:hypothetical protein